MDIHTRTKVVALLYRDTRRDVTLASATTGGLETRHRLCLSNPCLANSFAGQACSCQKGKTLRTAIEKKADNQPSTAGIDGMAEVSRALEVVLASLDDSKAENITTINLQGKSSLGDYMVIASGRSHRHVAALAEHVITALKDGGFGAPRVEGMAGADWVLIDTGDIIVHVFRPEVREFYNIEKMWQAPDLDEETVH